MINPGFFLDWKLDRVYGFMDIMAQKVMQNVITFVKFRKEISVSSRVKAIVIRKYAVV